VVLLQLKNVFGAMVAMGAKFSRFSGYTVFHEIKYQESNVMKYTAPRMVVVSRKVVNAGQSTASGSGVTQLT